MTNGCPPTNLSAEKTPCTRVNCSYNMTCPRSVGSRRCSQYCIVPPCLTTKAQRGVPCKGLRHSLHLAFAFEAGSASRSTPSRCIFIICKILPQHLLPPSPSPQFSLASAHRRILEQHHFDRTSALTRLAHRRRARHNATAAPVR